MEIVLYVLGAIGLTHIMVDSKIIAPIREWLEKPVWPSFLTVLWCLFIWPFLFGYKVILHPIQCVNDYVIPPISSMIGCYQCCGFWMGLVAGWFAFTNITWGQLLCAGFGGSFLASLAVNYLNYLEAVAVISLPPEEEHKDG